MQDMVPKGTGNSRFLKSAIPANISHEELVAMLRAGTFPVDFAGLNPEGIATQGTPLNKATLLRDETAEALQLPASGKTVDAALQKLVGGVGVQRAGDIYTTFRKSVPNNYILCDGGTTDAQALQGILMPQYFNAEVFVPNAPNMSRIIKLGDTYIGMTVSGSSSYIYISEDLYGPYTTLSLTSSYSYAWTDGTYLYWLYINNAASNGSAVIYRGIPVKSGTYWQINNQTTVRSVALTNTTNSKQPMPLIIVGNTLYAGFASYTSSGSYGYYQYYKFTVNMSNNTFSAVTTFSMPINSYQPQVAGTLYYSVANNNNNTSLTIQYYDVVSGESKTVSVMLTSAFDIKIDSISYVTIMHHMDMFYLCMAINTAGGMFFAYAVTTTLSAFENLHDYIKVLTQFPYIGMSSLQCSAFNNLLCVKFTEEHYISNSNRQVSPQRMLLIDYATGNAQQLIYTQMLVLPGLLQPIENPENIALYYVQQYGRDNQSGIALSSQTTSMFVPFITGAYIKGDDVI